MVINKFKCTISRKQGENNNFMRKMTIMIVTILMVFCSMSFDPVHAKQQNAVNASSELEHHTEMKTSIINAAIPTPSPNNSIETKIYALATGKETITYNSKQYNLKVGNFFTTDGKEGYYNCPTHGKERKSNRCGKVTTTSNSIKYKGTSECYGFAYMIFEYLYPDAGLPNGFNKAGTKATRTKYDDIGFSNLKAGDVLNNGNIHTVVVYKITATTVHVYHANWGDPPCEIKIDVWNKASLEKNLKKTGTTLFVLRYKGNTPANEMKLSGPTAIEVGKSLQIKPSFMPSDSVTQKVTWAVNDNTIAKVDSNGNVTGLQTGTVVVTATSEKGLKKNITINIVEKILPPPTPTGLKAERYDEITGVVTWYKVTGATYIVEYKSVNTKNKWIQDTEYTNNTTTSYKPTNQGDGITYSYRVKAVVNGVASEDWTTTEYVHKKTVPVTSVSWIKAEWYNSNTAKVSWEKVANATYIVEYKSKNTKNQDWVVDKEYTNNKASEYYPTNQGDGVVYSYRIKAVINGASSSWVTAGYTHTQKDPNAIVATPTPNITVNAPSWAKSEWHNSNTAKVSWENVANATYVVEYKSKNTKNQDWVIDKEYTNNRATEYYPTNQGDGVVYSYRIKAVINGVSSPWTNAGYTHTQKDPNASSQPTATTPNTPTGLTAERHNEITGVVSWNQVAGATSYEVEYKSVNTGNEFVVDKEYTNKTALSFKPTNQGNGVTYTYRVRAVNSAGKSDWATVTYVHKK